MSVSPVIGAAEIGTTESAASLTWQLIEGAYAYDIGGLLERSLPQRLLGKLTLTCKYLFL